jgi:16S rRNA U516 pseudouridylate synthase RsuA-like enzyme
VTLNTRPGKLELEKMTNGYIDEGANERVVPVAVALDDSDPSKRNRVRIIVAEGRNREVRNIVEAAGMDVKVLRRIRVGGYRIPRDLAFGRYVELKPHEVRRILNVGADRSM